MFLKITTKSLYSILQLLATCQVRASTNLLANKWKVLDIFSDCTIQFSEPTPKTYDPVSLEKFKKFTTFYYEFLHKCQIFQNCISIHTKSKASAYLNSTDVTAILRNEFIEKSKELRILLQAFTESMSKHKFISICKVSLPKIYKASNGYIELNHEDNNWSMRNSNPSPTGKTYHTTTVSQDYILIPHTSSTEITRINVPVNFPATLVLLNKVTKQLSTGCQYHGDEITYEIKSKIPERYLPSFDFISIDVVPVFKFPATPAIILSFCKNANVPVYKNGLNSAHKRTTIYQDQCSKYTKAYLHFCIQKTILDWYNMSVASKYPTIVGLPISLSRGMLRYSPYGAKIEMEA